MKKLTVRQARSVLFDINCEKADKLRRELFDIYEQDKPLTGELKELEAQLEKERERKEWLLHTEVVGDEDSGFGVTARSVKKDHDLRGVLFEATESTYYIGRPRAKYIVATGRTADEAIDAAIEAEQ